MNQWSNSTKTSRYCSSRAVLYLPLQGFRKNLARGLGFSIYIFSIELGSWNSADLVSRGHEEMLMYARILVQDISKLPSCILIGYLGILMNIFWFQTRSSPQNIREGVAHGVMVMCHGEVSDSSPGG